MTQLLIKTIADFATTLVTKVAVGDTTATLTSATDSDSVALPTGTYGFTIDRNNSAKEHFTATLTGTALTNIKTVTRGTGVGTAGFARKHRKGAEIIISDHVAIKRMMNVLDGTTGLDSATPLAYDAAPTLTPGSNQIATVAYADAISVAGAANATTTTKGIVEIATQAEIDAGTSTGGTGASVVVRPDQLATSIYNTQLPTSNQKAALAGTSGAPSVSNKYVTDADTTGTGSIPRSSVVSSDHATFTAGASITAGQPLHISPYIQTDGGIILDAQQANAYAGTTNQTVSMTVGNNTNRVLLVAVLAGAAPSGVTYNSVAMVLADSRALSAGSSTLYVYKLVAPATGANNITVTGTTIYGISAASYYNVNQSTYVEATAKADSSPALTTVSQGAFVHNFAGETNSTGTTTSGSITVSSKYVSTGGTFTSVSGLGAAGLGSIMSSTVGKVNEVQSLTINASIPGGSGTVGVATIAISLAPVTAVTTGVVPTNSSAAVINEPLVDFIGFADATVSLGASISVTLAKVVTGLSGLTAGKKYYLQDTSGTLGTTRGTYGKVIGYALTTTTLHIATNKTVGAAISKIANYTYTAEIDGTFITKCNGSNTVITDGVTYTGVANANMTVPVSRGKTYIVSAGATDNYFIPLA